LGEPGGLERLRGGERVERLRQLAEGGVDGRAPELLLAAEVVLEEPEIDAGGGGDVAGAGAVEAALGKDGERAAEDAVPGIEVGGDPQRGTAALRRNGGFGH